MAFDLGNLHRNFETEYKIINKWYICTDGGKIPDGDGAGLSTNDERAAVLQQFHGANVVIALLVTRHNRTAL